MAAIGTFNFAASHRYRQAIELANAGYGIGEDHVDTRALGSGSTPLG